MHVHSIALSEFCRTNTAAPHRYSFSQAQVTCSVQAPSHYDVQRADAVCVASASSLLADI